MQIILRIRKHDDDANADDLFLTGTVCVFVKVLGDADDYDC